MSRRSRGRNNPSRGARVERRKAERAKRSAPPPGPPAVMRVPDTIRQLTDKPKEDHCG